MIRLGYKKCLLSIDEVWDIYDNSDIKAFNGTDILVKKITKKNGSEYCRKRKTLITDLKRTPEEIYGDFDNQVKRSIKRVSALSYECQFHDSTEFLKDDRLFKEFKESYYEFIKKKKLLPGNLSKLKKFALNNNLTMAVGILENSPLVYRVFIHDDNYVRGLYSVSKFRNTKVRKEQNNIAYLNKMLLYQELLYFRNKNLSIYDWGGISDETEDKKRISYFKRQFGGKEFQYFETMESKSLRGRIALKVINKLL